MSSNLTHLPLLLEVIIIQIFKNYFQKFIKHFLFFFKYKLLEGFV